MRKNCIMGSIVATLALAFGLSFSIADDKPKSPEKPAKVYFPECPVSDKPINFLVHTDTADGPVYFCCDMCIGKYKKNSKRYSSSVKVQRAAVAKLPKVQVICTICDKVPAKDKSLEYEGQTAWFCGDKCAMAFTKNPGKHVAKLAAKCTYQTTCPVGDEKIDPSSSITLNNGGKIYFCCDKCKPAFKKDLAKYSPKLEAQGYYVKETDLKKS